MREIQLLIGHFLAVNKHAQMTADQLWSKESAECVLKPVYVLIQNKLTRVKTLLRRCVYVQFWYFWILDYFCVVLIVLMAFNVSETKKICFLTYLFTCFSVCLFILWFKTATLIAHFADHDLKIQTLDTHTIQRSDEIYLIRCNNKMALLPLGWYGEPVCKQLLIDTVSSLGTTMLFIMTTLWM